MKHLLVIAIEEYHDPLLGKVAWAINDAEAFAKVWKLHGLAKAQRYVHLNEDASKTSLESRLRRLQKELTEEDELVIYYAGHGFFVNGHNVLSAWDTQYRDIEHTSIPLEYILQSLRCSDCRQVKLFLDACHTGVEIDSAMRGIDAGMSDDELREFLKGAEHCVAFAACHADEQSYSSGKLKHGIWTYHVIQALSGDASLALVSGHLVTSTSLQNYLRKEVPRTVRETVTGGPAQNPWMFGGSDGEFLLVDVKPILLAREAKPEPAAAHLPRLSFYGEESLQVRQLSGFKPFHRVPKTVDDRTRSFVEGVGTADVEHELDEAYGVMRNGMGYRRRDLKKDFDGSGSGTIITPDFDFNVSLSQDTEDAAQAILHREVTHIRNPGAVLSDEFQSTFQDMFDTVEFDVIKKIDVVAVIDRIEEFEPKGVELLNYNDDGDFCELRIHGVDGTVRIEPHVIQLASSRADSPRELLQLFGNTWNMLLSAAPQGMLPPPKGTESK